VKNRVPRACLLGLGLGLTLAGWFAASGAAALEVALAVSPAQTVVGRPVEVLVRTFTPVGSDQLDLPRPLVPNPAPSGVWNVLYPIADYPFDVVAEANSRDSFGIPLVRDPDDATLWRGSFTPTSPGEWTIRVRNFPPGEPGTSARVLVTAGESIPTVAVVGAFALLIGLLLGTVVGRRSIRPRSTV